MDEWVQHLWCKAGSWDKVHLRLWLEVSVWGTLEGWIKKLNIFSKAFKSATIKNKEKENG